MVGAESCNRVSAARYAPANCSGMAASNTDSAWPNFIAPPLSSPKTRNTCSAVRSWTSVVTNSAGRPPMRRPIPIVARPAAPSGREANLAVRATAFRATSLTLPLWPLALAADVAGRSARPPAAARRMRFPTAASRKPVGQCDLDGGVVQPTHAGVEVVQCVLDGEAGHHRRQTDITGVRYRAAPPNRSVQHRQEPRPLRVALGAVQVMASQARGSAWLDEGPDDTHGLDDLDHEMRHAVAQEGHRDRSVGKVLGRDDHEVVAAIGRD